MLSQACSRRSGTVAIYCADVMLNDVIGTQESQLSSSKSTEMHASLLFWNEIIIWGVDYSG